MGRPRAGEPGRLRYVLANWKMYPTVDEARALLQAIQDDLRARVGPPEVIVCAPFVALPALCELCDRTLVRLGAQTCHWEQEGPYTGEVSPRMLHGLVDYVMVGHSDRRTIGETDDHVAAKVAAVIEQGLVPIVFVGEDDPADDPVEVTAQRLRHALSRVDPGRHELLLVYEPAWAIGADRAAPADHVRRVVEHLKQVLEEFDGEPIVLYGGTVNDENVDELAGVEALDGVGATRASLDPATFFRLIDRLAGA